MKTDHTGTLQLLRNLGGFSIKAKNLPNHSGFAVSLCSCDRCSFGTSPTRYPGWSAIGMTARTHLQPELPGTAKNLEDIFSAQESIIFSEFNLHNIKDDINFNMKYMSNNISASIIIIVIEQCIILTQCQPVLREGSLSEVTRMEL